MPAVMMSRSGSSRLDLRSNHQRAAASTPGAQSLDLLGDVLGIVLHPADERRAPCPLPVQPEEVQARKIGQPTSMANPASPSITGTSSQE